ncbi:hypothetical protein HCG49_17060 [Arenibacter sp. 6A1]|uniref:hypothetical protein n=1 Tax=Arenibacter sp. 6A1 TaxID=2720391 RepID=UPI00144643EA|nr:hypothetical protein [Arenibacter sp. 6A1]NKI28266.1 hypothetical protein [Arenibacter sp. 6A1]
MTLVIKSLGTTAPSGAKKLYRDALVVNGTLFHVDFSNRGSLNNFNIRKDSLVYDLSRESSIPLGITTTGSVNLISDIDLTLTDGKGFTLENPNLPVNKNQGLYFNAADLMSYLVNNQPHCVWVGWARRKINADDTNNELVRSVSGGDYSIKNIRSNITYNTLTPTFGGGSYQIPINEGELFQFAIEFTSGQKNKVYLNKNFIGDGSVVSSGFIPADKFGLFNSNVGTPTGAAFYRTFIEDLDVSGRKVEDILQKDWQYVHGIGQFEGVEKRPFVDNY